MKSNELCLRPHHGVCLLHYAGRGYSEEFTRQMTALSERLCGEPETLLHLEGGGDLLCRSCPHWHGICESAEKVERLDREWLAAAGVDEGEQLCWREYRERLLSCISQPKMMERICGDCEWFEFCRTPPVDNH